MKKNITKDVLPYVQQVFEHLQMAYEKKFDLKDYTLNCTEKNKFHKYCPYGFDMDIDMENKRIYIEFCSQNDGYNMRGFKQVLFEEIEQTLLGYVIYNTKPFVKKTKNDMKILNTL